MKDTELFSLFSYVSLVLFSLLRGAKCETYTVGDDEGWTTGVNYHTWSTEYDFKVNDTLVFKYIKGQHNVYEVIEDTYRSCNASTGVLAKYARGNDQIKLTKAKEYWFICNIVGHCQGGMRFLVNLTDASKASPSRGTETTPLPNSGDNSSAFIPVPALIYYYFALGIFLQILSCYIQREK